MSNVKQNCKIVSNFVAISECERLSGSFAPTCKTQNPQQQTLNPLIAGPFFYVNIIVFARISLFQYTIIPLLCNALCHTAVWSDYKFYRQMLWFFFHPLLRIKSKASAYMPRHLHIKSKTSAYSIGTCFRFYM